MIKENLLVALRNFWKAKTIALINIFSLSIGISAALVIFLIIQYNYSFDKHQPNADRIYRVVTGGKWNNSGISAPLPRTLKSEGTGIEAVAHFFQYDDWNVNVRIPAMGKQEQKLFKKQKGIIFSDQDYFKIIPHKWLAGSAQTSLKEPNTVVLSENRLAQYLPNTSPDQALGQTIVFADSILTTISGVVKDIDANTDFDNRIFISLNTVKNNSGLEAFFNWDEWNNTNSISQCLILLSPGTSSKSIEGQIASLFDKYNKPEEGEKNDVHVLQPLNDIHFNTDFNYEGTDKSILRNLSLLALFLLLLGTINFINLSTAQSSERAKEIGVRKTLGSSKGQLIWQFLQETFLLTLLSSILSILMVPILFQAFSGFIPTGLTYESLWQSKVFLFIVLEIIVVTLLAGLYPAFVLTRFNPVQVLKNQVSRSVSQTRSAWVRKVLTVSQFVIAQVFVIAVWIVSEQIHFAVNKDMGFRKDAVVNFYIPDFMEGKKSKKKVLLEELKRISEIQTVSLGNQSPAFSGSMSNGITYKDGEKEVKLSVDARNGDENYLDVYKIPVTAGRNIHLLDSGREVLINESMVKLLGFKNSKEAIGAMINLGDPVPVVGVMKDFNLASVRSPVKPLMYFGDKEHGYVIHIALRPDDMTSWKTALGKMSLVWQKVYPNDDFEYTFLDKTVESFYQQDLRLSKLLRWAMGISIFICSVGLLGLVIFLSNQRIKEIGVRKVLGASVFQIIMLLSKSLLSLVGLACIIAFPIASYFMHDWLQDFAYHITLQWWMFLISGLAMLALSWLIVCIKAGKAAVANPVDSLRDE